jgi:hypothetical protein
MELRDLNSNYKPVAHVVAQAITATNTPSSGVDRSGFGAVEFLINVGTMTNVANSPQPTWAFHLEHSDSASSNFSAVTDANDVLIGSSKSPVTTPNASTGVFLTIDDAAEDAAVYSVGYVGTKRYVRLVATAANTPGSTPYAVTALLAKPAIAPTSH